MEGTELDPYLRPSTLGWLQLLPQRMRSSTKHEDKEIMEKFAKMKILLVSLKEIESNIKQWVAQSSRVAKIAQKLGQALQTPPDDLKKVSWDIKKELDNQPPLEFIRDKIKMVEGLIAQKKTLEFIRLRGEAAGKKLSALELKPATEARNVQKEKLRGIERLAGKERERIMQNVAKVVDMFVGIAEEGGVMELVRPQVQAFKLSQFSVFLNCQKLIQGPEDDIDLQDLEKHWEDFRQSIAVKIPNKEAGGSFSESGMLNGKSLTKEGNFHKSYRDSDFDGEDLAAFDEQLKEADGKVVPRPSKSTDIEMLDGEDLDDEDEESVKLPPGK